LLELVRSLPPAVEEVVVVNDGSGAEFAAVFEGAQRDPRVRVLEHAVNLGKGAALRTGLNYCLCARPNGGSRGGANGRPIVTADADGQHTPADIVAVGEAGAANPGALVLGARRFEGEVPARSLIGNLVTRSIMRAVVGCRLTDTQTGLRAIPAALIP